MTGVGFEPTSTNTSELESDPLDHSGNQPGLGVTPIIFVFIFLSYFCLLFDFVFFLSFN